jgi:hypothetical protein
MTASSCSPFIPAGSYQESLSSNTIQVTLAATCQNETGGSTQSTLTYNSSNLSGYADISNNNGNLTLVLGSGSPINTENPYVPAGSYQNSSSDIQITLTATCRNEKGDGVTSSITYTEQDAKKFSSIENSNGYLESVTSSSISLPTVSESDEGDEDEDGADEDGAADGGEDAGAEAGGDAAADAGGDAAAAGGADAAADTAAAAGGADAAADASAAAAALCA